MKENYLLHKLHSLTGIIPVGFYMVQHLTLNTFSLAGPDAYNAVIQFFEGMPKHILYGLKYGLIWLPLIFHAVYGLFIVARADMSYTTKVYKFRENTYFTLQRWSGIAAFAFLCYHMTSTSIVASVKGAESTIYYDTWANHLLYGFFGIPGGMLLIYFIGVTASSYHFSYGIWNFCIRWGITISERAQNNMAHVAKGAFVFLTAAGCLSLMGFFFPILQKKDGEPKEVKIERPLAVPVADSSR